MGASKSGSPSGGSGTGPQELGFTTRDKRKAKQKKKDANVELGLTPEKMSMTEFIKGGGLPGVVVRRAIEFKDENNFSRRTSFAKKNNVSLKGLSKKQILSKDFRSKLDAKGYAKTLTSKEVSTGNNGGGNDNNTRINNTRTNNTQTIIKKNIGGNTIQTTAPTEAEVSQSEAANADAAALKVKKRGRSASILTGSKGVTKMASNYTLGVKNLLGRV
jgi:hypothetical protein